MERGQKGLFAHGNRGGPGRPRGSRNKSRLLVEAIEKVYGGEIEFIVSLLEAAKSGNDAMAKQVFDRLIAPANKETIFDSPLSIGSGSSAEKANQAIQAALDGDISLEQANALVSMLASQSKLEELEEVRAELAMLKTRIYGERK